MHSHIHEKKLSKLDPDSKRDRERIPQQFISERERVFTRLLRGYIDMVITQVSPMP